jgi:hypothetical protein
MDVHRRTSSGFISTFPTKFTSDVSGEFAPEFPAAYQALAKRDDGKCWFVRQRQRRRNARRQQPVSTIPLWKREGEEERG